MMSKYIYESPDGGNTIYKRKFGNYEKKSQEKIMDKQDYKVQMAELITKSALLDEIINMVNSTPNNMELGKKIRQRYWEIEDQEKNHDQLSLFGEGDY